MPFVFKVTWIIRMDLDIAWIARQDKLIYCSEVFFFFSKTFFYDIDCFDNRNSNWYCYFSRNQYVIVLCILILCVTNLSFINIHNPYNHFRYLRNPHLCWQSIAGQEMLMAYTGTLSKQISANIQFSSCLLCKHLWLKYILCNQFIN